MTALLRQLARPASLKALALAVAMLTAADNGHEEWGQELQAKVRPCAHCQHRLRRH